MRHRIAYVTEYTYVGAAAQWVNESVALIHDFYLSTTTFTHVRDI